jgi:hypothetical protein
VGGGEVGGGVLIEEWVGDVVMISMGWGGMGFSVFFPSADVFYMIRNDISFLLAWFSGSLLQRELDRRIVLDLYKSCYTRS